MGQYYRPVLLKDKTDEPKAALSSYDFGNGAKLMEHSYVGNFLVLAVEHLLLENPQRLVWAGDYADEEPCGKNLYDLSKGAIEDNEGKEIPTGVLQYKPVDLLPEERMNEEMENVYVVNKTKGVFYRRPQTRNWTINPLPLLTCEGNGRGGGDYWGSNMDLVGTWARDLIFITPELPVNYDEIDTPVFKDEDGEED